MPREDIAMTDVAQAQTGQYSRLATADTDNRMANLQGADDTSAVDQTPPGGVDNEDPMTIEDIHYGAGQIQALLIPVSVCMVLVVITVRSITYFATNPEKQYIAYASIFKEDDGQTNYQNVMSAVGNALMLIVVVVIMTFGLVLLFKYNCYRVIRGWLILSSQMLLMTFGLVYLQQVLLAVNYPVDWISVAFFIWNFSIVGTMCIHWRGPLILTQAYLIISSVLMALVFIKHLPPITTWAVLIIVALYDIVAVLCPGGPLKMLVETAQERNEPLLPSLVYSTTMAYIVSATVPSEQSMDGDSANVYEKDYERAETDRIDSPVHQDPIDPVEHHEEDANDDTAHLLRGTDVEASGDISDLAATDSDVVPTTTDPASNAETRLERRRMRRRRRRRRQELEEARQHMQEEQDEGVKLGLGDFIFYSVLIGKGRRAESHSDYSLLLRHSGGSVYHSVHSADCGAGSACTTHFHWTGSVLLLHNGSDDRSHAGGPRPGGTEDVTRTHSSRTTACLLLWVDLQPTIWRRPALGSWGMERGIIVGLYLPLSAVGRGWKGECSGQQLITQRILRPVCDFCQGQAAEVIF